MIYPSESVAPSIFTDFVNGIKIDICEVDKAAHNMLNSSKERFFLVVEDNHIVRYDSAVSYFEKTGEVRWDLFCGTKQDCINMITEFSDAFIKISANLQRMESKPVFTISCMGVITPIRERMINKFGVSPA